MKRILFLLLLIALPLQAQSNLLKMEKKRFTAGSAVDLDGTAEYMSKNSPVNLDLNGAERITNAADRDFSTLVNWAVLGDASNKIGRSSVDKHAGTYSMVDTTSGAGSTTNCVNLPYANFTALGTDANSIYEKYTLELWARATNAGCKITISIGGKSVQSGNLSTTTGAFTKVVFNFQATANEINQPIKLYLNQADVIYLDDVSLTKAWDMLVNVWINHADQNLTVNERILYGLSSSGYFRIMGTASQQYPQIGLKDNDGIGADLLFSDLDVNTGAYNLLTAKINSTATNGILFYKNGVVSTAYYTRTAGKTNLSSLLIGSQAAINTYFSGQIGEVQIIKFTDIAQSNVNTSTLLQAYRGGLSTWSGGSPQIVAWYDFRGNSDSQMLRDKSGNGNNLTGTNVTTADQVRGTYPSK